MKGIAWVVAALLGCVLLAWAAPSRACGMAWGGVTTVPPKPADEQVLMLWDRETQVEHFVRQVRFSDAKEPFGFIVPTPTRPELHDIQKEPWKAFEQQCAPRWSTLNFPLGVGGLPSLGYGSGAGRGGGGSPPPVKVLEERQLGDFKAFVLEASDAKGFSAWLKKNQFKSTPELEAWLAHYVELKFYYVALRYEGTKGQKGKAKSDELISKTVHISFQTPNPYYPYLEPLTKPGAELPKERKLQVWFIGDQVMQPVARFWGEGAASESLVRPWTETHPCDGTLAGLVPTLDPELGALAKKSKRVQVFADVKTSREGYGDVLLVPSEPGPCAGKCATQRDHLAQLLEAKAELRRAAPKAAPGSAPEPYLAPASCGIEPRGNMRWAWLWLGVPLFGFALRRRRRRRRLLMVSVLLCVPWLSACEDHGAPSAPQSAAPSSAPAPAVAGTNSVPEPQLELPKDAAAQHAKLVELLGGKLGGLTIPVQATDARTGIGAVTDALPKGMPSAGALAVRCAPGPHVEKLIRVEINHDEPGAPISVIGPISDTAKKCIVQAIREVPPERLKSGVERFSLGFGPNTQHQRQIQRRFAASYQPRRPGGFLRVRLEEFTVQGRLPKEVVRRIQRQNYGRFRHCAERSQQQKKKLEEISVRYVVDSEGNVKNVRSTPDGGAAGECIRKAFAAQRFPKPEGGVVQVSGKLTFEYPEPKTLQDL